MAVRFHLAPRILAATCAVLLAGCEQGPPRAQVSGQVTFQGKPVAEALLLLSNAELGVYMTTDVVDGRYEVVTATGKGVQPGVYQVAISPPPVDHPVGPILEPPRPIEVANIPRRYHDPQNSGLSAELVAGENVQNFDMQP